MGFLDRLLKNATTQALTNIVKDALSDDNANTQSAYSAQGSSSVGANTFHSNKSFHEKLNGILLYEGNTCEMRQSIPAEELEAQFAQSIFTRSGGRCAPNAISYGIYKNGAPVLYIRLWDSYADYNHTANRQVKAFCDSRGIKMLDFFNYLPNEESYMAERIRTNLVSA